MYDGIFCQGYFSHFARGHLQSVLHSLKCQLNGRGTTRQGVVKSKKSINGGLKKNGGGVGI